mgnify:FL=1
METRGAEQERFTWNKQSGPKVAVIGAGPAGLMAAETLAGHGAQVTVLDAMPSVGRKFLMAGKGGMNITHSEPFVDFVQRYGARADALRPMLESFGPDALREWVAGLGVETFVGSSGRVFPKEMKAAPLLRAWVSRLRGQGVRFEVRHRWQGWAEDGGLLFDSAWGERQYPFDAVVLALGGGSWPKLGSDGAWTRTLHAAGAEIAPLRPSNCGFEVGGWRVPRGWSEHFRSRYVGQALKRVRVSAGLTHPRLGELVITDTGVEGGIVYALSPALRDNLEAGLPAALELDLLPDHPAKVVADEVVRPRGSRSLSSHLQSRLGLRGVKMALLRELLTDEQIADPEELARAIKCLSVPLIEPRPLAEAISSAGGVCFASLDEGLMLRSKPGTFCVGEMLDWEAPTGGYLLTACFATGRWAAEHTAKWLMARAEAGRMPHGRDEPPGRPAVADAPTSGLPIR